MTMIMMLDMVMMTSHSSSNNEITTEVSTRPESNKFPSIQFRLYLLLPPYFIIIHVDNIMHTVFISSCVLYL